MIGLPVEELHSLIRDVPKPVIARVQGYAIGGGNVLATLCDFTIASERAVFGQVGPKVGSVDPGFGTAYLARVVGEKKAREIWYLCRRYTAQEAHSMGLVNAVVPHDQRTPRGARPLSLTMFVLTAVSSINTSRAGSSIPCSRIQRRRARATSARCRSAACSTFFESDVVSVEKTPERAAAGFDPSLAQFCNRFYQGQVRPLGDQIQNLDRELFQRRNAPAARLRGGAPLLIRALQPLYRRRHADLETLRCLASRRTGLHSCDNALPQVTRIGLRHPSPDKRRINARRLPHSEPAGNPTDSNKPGTALGCLPIRI